MEINITQMFKDINHMPNLSGSIMELGANAGAYTWNNSKVYAVKYPLLKPNQIKEAKSFFKSFGAWSKKEIDAWSDLEVQALTVQHVAGELRELAHYESLEDYDKAAEAGQVSGTIFQSCKNENEYYIYLGN